MLEEMSAPSVSPRRRTPCLCHWLRGLWGCTRRRGLSLHRACFLFVAGLSPGPALPRAGDDKEPLAAWGAGDAAVPCSRCSVCLWAGGWRVPVQTQGSAPERFGPARPSLGDASPHWDGTGLQLAHGAPRGSRGLSLPLLCTIFTFFWVQTEARLLGLWLQGAPAVLSAVLPVIAPCAGARMPLLGCGQCRAGRAKPFAAPAHPNPCFAGGRRKNAFFSVVETQRQQGLISGAVGARDLGLPRARRAPTPRMSVVSL